MKILLSFTLGFLICAVLLTHIKLVNIEQLQMNKVQTEQSEQINIEPQINDSLYKQIKFLVCKANMLNTIFKTHSVFGGFTGADDYGKVYDNVFFSKDTIQILYTCDKLNLKGE